MLRHNFRTNRFWGRGFDQRTEPVLTNSASLFRLLRLFPTFSRHQTTQKQQIRQCCVYHSSKCSSHYFYDSFIYLFLIPRGLSDLCFVSMCFVRDSTLQLSSSKTTIIWLYLYGSTVPRWVHVSPLQYKVIQCNEHTALLLLQQNRHSGPQPPTTGPSGPPSHDPPRLHAPQTGRGAFIYFSLLFVSLNFQLVSANSNFKRKRGEGAASLHPE